VRGSLIKEMRDVLRQIDDIAALPELTVDHFSDYVGLNGRFHALLVEAAESPVLKRQIERTLNLPFASPSGFVMVQAMLPEASKILTIAQDHHHCAVRAIEDREGARAEALMREHARLAHRNLQLALGNQGTRGLVPGAVLIRRSSAAALY
jgi:GntR family transcriptional regulator of vanillate catabolism